MVSTRKESQFSGFSSLNLKDFIITIPNVLPADEYFEILDHCEQTSDFTRKEKHNNDENTLNQNGSRYDIELTPGRIYDLIRKAFLFGLDEVYPYYDYLIPKEFYHYCSGYWLLKYIEGDYLSCHNDFDAESGSLTMSYLINDDYEGGELQFWKEYKIPNQKNSLHIFPSCLLYPHEVLPITNGIRYSAITWFGAQRPGMDKRDI